jgi:hypothetical protein
LRRIRRKPVCIGERLACNVCRYHMGNHQKHNSWNSFRLQYDKIRPKTSQTNLALTVARAR